MRSIYVFGSNLAGRHNKGSALIAKQKFGAKQGISTGLRGLSYAIPTKDEKMNPLPLSTISFYVDEFIEFANKNPELTFFVTRAGCGLARYKDSDIAPLFRNSPLNCTLPLEWINFNNENKSNLIIEE